MSIHQNTETLAPAPNHLIKGDLACISSNGLIFFIKPLLSKWLKAFKAPSIRLIGGANLDEAPWKKRLKASQLHQVSQQQLLVSSLPEVDCVVWIHPVFDEALVLAAIQGLKKGGALIVVSGNLHRHWPELQAVLDKAQITHLFPMGFHPQRAVAWWPFTQPVLRELGQLVEFVATFFPGRYPLGLRFGRCWMVVGYKRDDITVLSS